MLGSEPHRESARGNFQPPDARSINVAGDPRSPAPVVLRGQPPGVVAGALSCAVAGAMRSPSPMSTNGAQAKGCEKTSEGPPGEPAVIRRSSFAWRKASVVSLREAPGFMPSMARVVMNSAESSSTDQCVTRSPRVPAKKKARARPERLSPAAPPGPAVVQAVDEARAAHIFKSLLSRVAPKEPFGPSACVGGGPTYGRWRARPRPVRREAR